MERILDNLISNSIKFSQSGTCVEICIDPEKFTVTIRDQGPGFTKADREHLFESYQRLSARPTAGEPSTGLGLSIAKRLARAMKGDLILSEEYTEGAEFVLQLAPAED